MIVAVADQVIEEDEAREGAKISGRLGGAATEEVGDNLYAAGLQFAVLRVGQEPERLSEVFLMAPQRSGQSIDGLVRGEPTVIALDADDGLQRTDEGGSSHIESACCRAGHGEVLHLHEVDEILSGKFDDVIRRGAPDGLVPSFGDWGRRIVEEAALILGACEGESGHFQGLVDLARLSCHFLDLVERHRFIGARFGIDSRIDDDVAQAIEPAGGKHGNVVVLGNAQAAAEIFQSRPLGQKTAKIGCELFFCVGFGLQGEGQGERGGSRGGKIILVVAEGDLALGSRQDSRRKRIFRKVAVNGQFHDYSPRFAIMTSSPRVLSTLRVFSSSVVVLPFSRLETNDRLTAHKSANSVCVSFWRLRSARMTAPISLEVKTELMMFLSFLRTPKL